MGFIFNKVKVDLFLKIKEKETSNLHVLLFIVSCHTTFSIPNQINCI